MMHEHSREVSIFSGDFVEDMEIAKAMIAAPSTIDLSILITIAADRTHAACVRIAAIYALGFLDDAGLSLATLARISGDSEESSDVKDHATEALASIQEPY